MFIRYALSTYVTVHNIQSVCDLTVLPCQPCVPLFTLIVDMHSQEPEDSNIAYCAAVHLLWLKRWHCQCSRPVSPHSVVIPHDMMWTINWPYDMTCQNLSQFFKFRELHRYVYLPTFENIYLMYLLLRSSCTY